MNMTKVHDADTALINYLFQAVEYNWKVNPELVQLLTDYIRFQPNVSLEYSFPAEEHIDKPIIYFLYANVYKFPYLFYVGQTVQGSERIAQHIKNGYPVDNWRYIEVPDIMLDEVENFYIRQYRPIFNYSNNPACMQKDGEHYIMSRPEFHERRERLIEYFHKLKEKEIAPTDVFRRMENGNYTLNIPEEYRIF